MLLGMDQCRAFSCCRVACCSCNKLARHWFIPKTPHTEHAASTTGSCRAHSPALHVGRRDRVASCSWPCASHPHAHLLICIYAVLTAKPGQDSVQLHTGRRRGQCRTMRPRALRRAGRRPRTTSDVPTGGTLPCAVAIRSPQSEVRCSLCVGHFTADGRDHLGEAPGTSYDS